MDKWLEEDEVRGWRKEWDEAERGRSWRKEESMWASTRFTKG